MSEDERKVFIGGLHADTRDEHLREHFEKFGELEKCTAKIDLESGRCRGFGFVVFATKEGIDSALNSPDAHMICNKQVEPKLAKPQEKPMKVFLGGLGQDSDEDAIKTAFKTIKNYSVTEVFLPQDRDTGSRKGFAFVTFSDSAAATELVKEDNKYITIDQKECEIKPAKSKNDQGGGRGGFRGGRGGPRGGRGGYNTYGGGYGGGGYGGGGYSGGGGYGSYGGYGGGYGGGGYNGADSQWGGGFNGHDQYKMKGGRGGAGYHPY